MRDLNPELFIRPEDNKLFAYIGTVPKTVRDRVIRVGWRHTLERIVLKNIPNVTRDTLGRKFNVNLWMYPKGSPEEMWDAVIAE